MILQTRLEKSNLMLSIAAIWRGNNWSYLIIQGVLKRWIWFMKN